MHAIVVDAETRRKLGNLAEPVLFKDESGQVIGEFLPYSPERQPELTKFRLRELAKQHPPAQSWHEEDGMEPQISEEELDLRERAGGGRPLADILADMEKRA